VMCHGRAQRPTTRNAACRYFRTNEERIRATTYAPLSALVRDARAHETSALSQVRSRS
jgi:hypothetical protein